MERDDVVPIVLGGADYHRYAPKNSYIDATKFSSAKDLANFIQDIDQNETERQKYFSWKTMYRARCSCFTMKICKLCEALHAPLTTWPIKSYPHIQDWWRGGKSGNGHCIQQSYPLNLLVAIIMLACKFSPFFILCQKLRDMLLIIEQCTMYTKYYK